jgi:phosphoribosylformylglycinamidine cyclo-ligase
LGEQNLEGLSYKSAGVNIESGNALVDRIKPIAAKTRTQGVLSGLGGFGSMFELPLDRYKQPILVSGTDGVGTKLKLASELNIHNSIGIDLVAMCVNDIIVQGAEPLFFLDYFACGRLDVDVAASVVEGIGKGCEMAGSALVGGETAEMPGMYIDGDYDLAGFCVGIVEKAKIIDGTKVKAGDTLLGIASSGPHSNGYSLIRKIIEQSEVALTEPLQDKTLGEIMLTPTRIYVKSLLTLFKAIHVHALAHVTGGGITENLPRVLPKGLSAAIDLSAWDWPEAFRWLKQQGNVSENEMLRTFNCGIGMIVCVGAQEESKTLKILAEQGEIVYRIGEVVVSSSGQTEVQYNH